MQQQALANVDALTKGLITERTTLTEDPQATRDELNCKLTTKGERLRRLGFDYETGYGSNVLPFVTAVHDKGWFGEHVWRTVGGDGGLTFVVIHVYDKLFFVDARQDPVSTGIKSFSVNLGAFLNSTAGSAENVPIQVASGRGHLFVVSEATEPIRITYDAETDSISVLEISLKIRDFDGVEDGEEVDERPSSLTPEHKYNIENQGWYANIKHDAQGSTRKVAWVFWNEQRGGGYPSDADVWWLWREADGDIDFRDSRETNEPHVGNTFAPRGHYFLNPFYKDRTAVSGIADIAVEQSPDVSPSSIAFYAGRVFYASKQGDILYSQIIEDVEAAGKCHSVNDPTSEENADILATDGGVIVVPEAGEIVGMRAIGQSLIIFANNGVWQLNGREGVFKADDFFVRRISVFGAMSNETIIEVEASVVWWNEFGVYTLQVDQVSQAFQPVSLSDQTIKTFLRGIPSLSKFHAKGVYDIENKKIYWLYRSTAPVNDIDRFTYDKILILDTQNEAFYPWTIESLSSSSPFISGLLYLPIFGTAAATEDVVDELGVTVTDGAGDDVTISGLNRTSLASGLKFLTITTDGTFYYWTLSEEKNSSYIDWETEDSTGVDFSSFFETGNTVDQIFPRRRQAQEILFYLGQETDSSAFITFYWDFANDESSGKYSTKQQVYRDSTVTRRGGVTRQSGRDTIVTSLQVNGSGRTVRSRVESEAGKPFNFFGWTVVSRNNPVP